MKIKGGVCPVIFICLPQLITYRRQVPRAFLRAIAKNGHVPFFGRIRKNPDRSAGRLYVNDIRKNYMLIDPLI
jgi:hypothetical protein